MKLRPMDAGRVFWGIDGLFGFMDTSGREIGPGKADGDCTGYFLMQ
jgi:hypothetical protein